MTTQEVVQVKFKCCRHCRHQGFNRSLDGHSTPCTEDVCKRGKELSDTPGSRTFWTRWSDVAGL